MLGFRCKHRKCNAKVRLPDFSESLKSEVARIVRQRSVIEAIQKLHSATRMDLGDSKAIGMHVTRKAGECNRCIQKLELKEGNCTKCGALNFDW